MRIGAARMALLRRRASQRRLTLRAHAARVDRSRSWHRVTRNSEEELVTSEDQHLSTDEDVLRPFGEERHWKLGGRTLPLGPKKWRWHDPDDLVRDALKLDKFTKGRIALQAAEAKTNQRIVRWAVAAIFVNASATLLAAVIQNGA